MLNLRKSVLKYALLSGLVAISTGLSGCMTRVAHEGQHDPAAEQQVIALTRQFAEAMKSGRGPALIEISSFPFWVDDWMDQQTLLAEMPHDAGDDMPELEELKVRIYPLSDLEVLNPRVWETLKAAKAEYIENMYLGAIALKAKDSAHTEHGFILLRKTAGKWTLAGLIEE